MATTASRAPSPGRSRSACRPAAGVSRVTPTRTAATGAWGLSSPSSPSAAVQSSPAFPDGCRRHHRRRDRLGFLDLEHHAHLAGRQGLGGEPAPERRGALPDTSEQDLEIPRGTVEHEPFTPRPLCRHRVDPSAVLATRQPVHPEAVGTELTLQIGRTQTGHRAEAVEPEGREPGGDRRVDGQHVERQRRQEDGFVAGANPADPTGMARPRCQAGDESRPRHAHGDLHVEHAAQSASQGGRPGGLVGKLGVPAGEIAERLLVTGFHRWREPVELGADGGTQPCDPGGIEGDEHRGGTGLLRLAERLPHPHPGGPRCRRSGDHREAQLRSTAEDHRLATQLGIATQGGQQPEMRMASTENAHLNLEPPRRPHPEPAGRSVASAERRRWADRPPRRWRTDVGSGGARWPRHRARRACSCWW